MQGRILAQRLPHREAQGYRRIDAQAMATIDIRPAPACTAAQLWPWAARAVQEWLAERTLPARDAVWLVPYAALLPWARKALAAAGGWQVRVETPLTLRESLAPPLQPVAGSVCGDPVRDRLQAAALLRRIPWGREREQRDAAGFRHLATLLADAAAVLAARGAVCAPAAREVWWQRVRTALPGVGGPAALETSLLRVAVEWAALPGPAASDVLHGLRPSAWIVLRLGGIDELAESVAAASGLPALVLQADPDPDRPFEAALRAAGEGARWPLQGRHACVDLESEAAATAEVVCRGLDAHGGPVALVATDRLLVRRVRALLEIAGVSISDETGWRLSTTAAAAQLMALLRAARPDARRDELLEWLKATPQGRQGWVSVLERRWRSNRSGIGDREREAEHLWNEVQWPLRALRESPHRTLADWLGVLDHCWHRDESRPDAAAVQRALHLREPDAAWLELAAQARMDLVAFANWVDETLDAANLEPPRDAQADVVLTPLARALGRPHAHVVLPAADVRTLGAAAPDPSLITPALARSLGLPDADVDWQRRGLAFAQLLRSERLTVLRRQHDGIEPLAASPLVHALAAEAAALGRPWPESSWSTPSVSVARQPWRPVEPRAARRLPARLSATAVEALRDCPYRFFVRSVLRLSQADELDAEAGKRDYGTWLHAALHVYHRDAEAAAGEDRAAAAERLRRVSAQCALELELDEADLLPYRASLERLLPDYLDWLERRRLEGWHWHAGEAWFESDPPALAPRGLQGRIDRIDLRAGGAAEVIDYKTGAAANLRQKVRQPLEDTQLIFYAALLRTARPDLAAVSACYVGLDDAEAPAVVAHPGVEQHVVPMLEGLASDLDAIDAGVPLRALGEGAVCAYCEARGLCRRDHRPARAEEPPA